MKVQKSKSRCPEKVAVEVNDVEGAVRKRYGGREARGVLGGREVVRERL